jgi:hypothetical protein
MDDVAIDVVRTDDVYFDEKDNVHYVNVVSKGNYQPFLEEVSEIHQWQAIM